MQYVKSYDFAHYTTRINNFLQRKDKQDIKVLQDFFCSFILYYWDGIILLCEQEQKESIEHFLSEICSLEVNDINSILSQLGQFKNSTTKRLECLDVKLILDSK
ncbi:hypothetical protein DR740_07840 [Campylobacter lari]|uniref:Uncharacterized protein n=1 Tax=Campylobacter lari TaxID=201 RepID=A0A7U8AR52_CAMLA|nr:hypothetical protein [Campylobacter lari]EAL5741297.1 hypothetical protein [Campylobacter lari]